ncbi:MAG: FdhF/YdeP family oxidoreductase [Methyloligellaceae bacterium]
MTDHSRNMPIGGGAKKVLYTLRTVQRIGLINSAKALNSKNTCKACAYGMGGQNGGMTNELHEFPSVCNKSVQAQSTDIQPAIPEEIFEHSIEDLRELSANELEHLGRLGNPIYKAAGADHYEIIDWDKALQISADRFTATEPNRSFFYSSGRSSNEAGFILQLLARVYGTNNVNNCSYYCHQATSVALGATIGTGTSTVELEDLTGCDLIFVIGANPSSNHPRFIHMLKACRERGGQVIVINPAKEPGLVRFAVPKSPKSMLTGGSPIASAYLQPRVGSDIALFKGIAKALLEMGGEDSTFISEKTTGFEAFRADITSIGWDEITKICGVLREDIEQVARLYKQSNNSVFAWGMGMTHHLHGVENIEYISNLALLRGMVGKRFSGLLPLRGHSNVQGIGTIGVKPVLAEEIFQKMENTLGINLTRTPGFDTMASLEAARRGEIDAALLMGGNLYGASPDSQWSADALNKIGFKLFLTTTLNQGHIHGVDEECIVLPVTARDEEWQPTTQESMFNFVRLSDGGIERLPDVRPESDILCDLGSRMPGNDPVNFQSFKAHSHVREAIAQTVPGMEELADIDVAKQEFHVRNRVMHEQTFMTSDGRAHFKVYEIPNIKREPEQFPYILTTVRSEGQFNTIIYEETDSYRQTDTRWCVMMNSQDIQKLGISDKQNIDLVSEFGKMEQVRVYPFDLPAGNMMAYFPEANVLCGTAVDHRSKTPGFKSIPVQVELT